MTFEEKKRAGLIFTRHNLNPNEDYISIVSGSPVCEPMGLSWWDREKGRYRTREEQEKYAQSVVAANREIEGRMQ